MATAKPKKEAGFEETLWKSADKLRGSVEPAEYKHVVLSLFFLKFASDKFEARRRELADEGKEQYLIIALPKSYQFVRMCIYALAYFRDIW
jgi:type I restriction enzyme M protein